MDRGAVSEVLVASELLPLVETYGLELAGVDKTADPDELSSDEDESGRVSEVPVVWDEPLHVLL